ncbi:unnamed protein product [Periconia digitata]|uniref:AB hydrolase-1 domain-containing protein n=1 Tax=Periconia digitata TaxID=1303443 RepID=A0A9W4U3B7_9PLEO|nr:unnamed protein product [Periconia digitata]
MSSEHYRIDEHVLEASHIRGFHRTTATSQEEVLRLAIKQYTPLNNTNPKPGDITIVAAHANAFPKELYEPLWDDLLKLSQQQNFGIRGIWIADVVHQGQSGILNETKLGDDPAWLDHSRDLLHMINTFRAQMPRPIIGIGHSMGGAQLTNLSLLHPRLFETLILIDPVIQETISLSGNVSPAHASVNRRDRWPSRNEAATSMLKNRFYQAWDRRVFDRWVAFGLRDLPTELYPSSSSSSSSSQSSSTTTTTPTISTEPTSAPPPPPSDPEVTLTTTKHHEVSTFLRPNFAPLNPSTPSSSTYSLANPSAINRRTHPDLYPTTIPQTPFYRGESMMLHHMLPFIRPSVFYIFGETSFFTGPMIDEKMERTGTGGGGSGGAKEGRVEKVVVKGAGHLIPMEKVGETAEVAARWIGREIERWRVWEREDEAEWAGRKGVERRVLTERHKEELKAWGESARPKKVGKAKL